MKSLILKSLLFLIFTQAHSMQFPCKKEESLRILVLKKQMTTYHQKEPLGQFHEDRRTFDQFFQKRLQAVKPQEK